MQLHVLASGSSGNAIFLELGGKRVLIDAGISARRIEQGLKAVGICASDLDAVLVTHEHSDHVSGLPVFTKRFKVPVYARRLAWDAFQPQHHVDPSFRRELGFTLDLGNVKVEPFSIPHDAAEPVGFRFSCGDFRCVVATDIGCVTQRMEMVLAQSDVLVFESNHDVDMLKGGPYPWFLKQRILGNKGHLSNHETGKTLVRIARKSGMHVFLAHLSQHNNRPEVAMKTVGKQLEECGCRLGEDVHLHLTYPDQTVSFKEACI